MARSEARLHFDVMDGLRGLSKDAKLLYMGALLVEPTVNQAGIGALRERRWAKETELSLEETQRALDELDAGRFALIDYDTEEVFVRTLIRRDGVADRPNVLWAACRAAEQVRSPRLRRALAEELRKLPPKPPDKQTKSGGVYVHPDPHAVADRIDPGPSGDPALEPFENPSGRVLEPLPKASCREPFSNHSRTPGGGGGGGGEGSSPVATQLEIKDQPRVRETEPSAARPPEAPPEPRPERRRRPQPYGPQALTPAELNATAHTVGSQAIINRWKTGHVTKYRSGVYHRMAKEVDYLLGDHADSELILVALRDWDGRGKGAPGFLRHCYDDAVRATRPASPLASITEIPKSKQCFDQGMRIAEERRAKRRAAEAAANPPELLLLPGPEAEAS